MKYHLYESPTRASRLNARATVAFLESPALLSRSYSRAPHTATRTEPTRDMPRSRARARAASEDPPASFRGVPPRSGLYNASNTCYLNATLQVRRAHTIGAVVEKMRPRAPSRASATRARSPSRAQRLTRRVIRARIPVRRRSRTCTSSESTSSATRRRRTYRQNGTGSPGGARASGARSPPRTNC